MELTLGGHKMKDDFYVISVGKTNLALGMECQIQSWEWNGSTHLVNTQNYQTLELAQHGLHNGDLKVDPNKRTERDFHRDQVAWALECLITDTGTSKDERSYPFNIQSILDKHNQVFNNIPPSLPLDRVFRRVIELEGAEPVIAIPYQHPRSYVITTLDFFRQM